MKTFGRALALMTMLVSCVFAAPTLAFATESNVYEVGNSKEFKNAVADINEKADGDYVIKLAADIESEASVSGPCPVTILGCGHTLTIGTYGSLQVMKGSHLSLGAADGSDTLTIKGSDEQNNDVPGLLYVEGTCDMYAGVTLAGREGNNYYGGGVTVYGGTFHMHGGTIRHCGINGGSVCYGGGVGVAYGGTFVMDGGEITDCYAIAPPSDPDQTFQSFGGGVFVAYGSFFTMNGGTISGNRADVGGGVMLSDNSAEMKIGGGSITGNTATICGGGLAAVGNDGAVVVNGTKLCNNVADGAASDVYLANTPAQLSSAGNMGERYLGSKPDDVTNKMIDGWYVDNETSVDDETSRYVDQSKDERQEYPDYANIGPGDEVCLIAAGSGSLSEFHAKYEFQSATPGQQLPDEVLALLPADGTRYPRGSEIGALTPSQTSVETADGTWTFVGYDRTTAEASMDNADDEGNVHFSGAWKFTRKPTPAQPGDGGATAGANPAGKADGASSEGAQLPQTSDAFGPGALLALIAAGATSLIAAVAIRE